MTPLLDLDQVRENTAVLFFHCGQKFKLMNCVLLKIRAAIDFISPKFRLRDNKMRDVYEDRKLFPKLILFKVPIQFYNIYIIVVY